jgi:hypothetical protein
VADDADCDGALTGLDCDDSDSTLGSVDNDADCDGVTSSDDCNDDDASQPTRDADCDGVRTAPDCDDTDAGLGAVADDADCDGALTEADCDDSDASVGAVADDSDCDGVTAGSDCDDTDASVPSADADCDGVLTADDCDDADPASTVRVEDVDCDGVLTDDDCDDDDPDLGAVATDPECDGLPECHAEMDDLGGEVVGTTAYLLITETRSWSSADSDCRDRGYDGLAIILDGDEQSAIARIAVEATGQPWIGLLHTDEWRWRDLTPSDSGDEYWWTAESGTGSGDRGVMLAGSGDGEWWSAGASESHKYVCECREVPIDSEY